MPRITWLLSGETAPSPERFLDLRLGYELSERTFEAHHQRPRAGAEELVHHLFVRKGAPATALVASRELFGVAEFYERVDVWPASAIVLVWLLRFPLPPCPDEREAQLGDPAVQRQEPALLPPLRELG
jgi:hypothetical protein